MLRATDINLTFQTPSVASIHYLGGVCWWYLPSLWPWPCWSGSENHTSVPTPPTACPSTPPAHDLENGDTTVIIYTINKGWSVRNGQGKFEWGKQTETVLSTNVIRAVQYMYDVTLPETEHQCVLVTLSDCCLVNFLGDRRGDKDLMEWGSSPCRCSRSGCTGSVWWGGCFVWLSVCRCPAQCWGLQWHFPSSSHWTAWTGLSWTELRGGYFGIRSGFVSHG